MRQTQPVSPADDPRILKVQVERAASTLGSSIIASPVWAVVVAVVCSEIFPYLGAVPAERAALVVVVICCAVAGTRIVMGEFYRAQRGGLTEADHRNWLRRLLVLNVVLSTAWGFAPWALWSEADLLNHVFIELICLAAVARFLVNRANHVNFFLASFLPMAVMLFIRCLIDLNPVDLILAAVVVLYAIQVILDSSYMSQRWDLEAQARFSYEDLSRALAEARDEALAKRAEAEAANTSKTAFLANVSHELRTPLNAILGFSELIACECVGPVGSPRYKEYAIDIHNSGTHLLSLINDLLDVAKIEAGRMEVVPQMVETEPVLVSALRLVSIRARERGQTLTIDVETSAAELYADERAFKQIVINLVSNAVKFTQEGGRIEVLARRNSSGDFELVVADNGPGLSQEKIDRIFQPFSRADNRYGAGAAGTGLGLALVRRLCELHGGRAWLESQPGQGTRAIVVLPSRGWQEKSRGAAQRA